ncbi:hypothetical protein CLNEO_25960 [Anaerotignum neopropionicum]|uniref:Uncharacterized protein n=1 Tax=Anaerotignum neopropionicum TaxID=36847 RepID=A0A136WC53_9FIRM|nr:DUF6470 family protein [Anaerotignum neopropionicum]KXL52080.1 hypothetical protein CLNEO_25960 [Anaerotignum neopropionicum]
MDPLLKITSVPLKLELKVNNARLEYNNSNAKVEISRNAGGLTIKSDPIKLDIDSFECYNCINPTVKTSIQNAAEKGKAAAYEATATYAREGKLFLNAKIGEDVIGKIAESKMEVNTNFGIAFTPTSRPVLNWSEPEITMEYELDKLNFDWKVMNGNFEFIPGNIEIAVTQRPDVVIEYIGGPIYVPPSADPEYIPITDLRA